MIRVLAAAAVLAGGAAGRAGERGDAGAGGTGRRARLGAGGQARLRHGAPGAEQRGVHAARVVAERGLLPRPQHAELPRAAVRGRRRPDASSARSSTTTRATSSPSPRACAPACRRCPGSLAFRQVTETARWKLTKTWITDPARPTVLAQRALRVQDRKPLALYVLADPAPGDDGNDDTGSSSGGRLVAADDASASAVAADPPLTQGTSGYRGTRERPVEAAAGDRAPDRLRRDRARQRRAGRPDARSTAAATRR